MTSGSRRVALPLVAALAVASVVRAQQLDIADGRFVVDGVPRFLTFITYFGAMGAADATADLAFVRDAGFDGVRIWPNSPDGPRLMRADGTLDPASLARLVSILDVAAQQKLIVDVTFTAEHIEALDTAHYSAAVDATTRALARFRNLLFDIQNERNAHGPGHRPLAIGDVRAIAASIKRIDRDRIVTASNSPGMSARDASSFTADTGLDVTAYHDPRVAAWYRREVIERIVAALERNGRPAYLQEPSRFPFPSTDRAEYFRQARANAKATGAAAWCFHTELGFDLRDASFRSRLESRPEPEWAFVMSLAATVAGAGDCVPVVTSVTTDRTPR